MFEFVVKDLAARIFDGSILPGDKLPTEHQLCDEFGVSRTVIRDALRSLSEKGLIQARPHSGTTVRGIEHWNFLDPQLINWAREMGDREGFFDMLMEARTALEVQTVGIAAAKATPEDLARIERALIEFERATEAVPPDLDAFNTADIEFHLAILAATKNLILQQFGALIKAALRATFEAALDGEKISEESPGVHRKLFEAIRDHDPETARAHMSRISGILYQNIDTTRRRHAERTDDASLVTAK